MHVGVLGGTGPAGSALASRLASVGIEVTIGSRSADKAIETCVEFRERWAGSFDLAALDGGDNKRAAAADVVIVATPWDAAAATVGSVAQRLVGKVVVSMANALARVGGEFEPLVPPRGSVAAHVQAAAPGAMVAAGLHHVPAKELGALNHPVESDVLICSDHPEATATTMRLVGAIPGLRPLDAGMLSNAAPIEAFAAVILQLNVRYKTHAAIRLTGIDA